MKIVLLPYISIFVPNGAETDFFNNTVYKGDSFDLFCTKKVNSTLKACFISTPKIKLVRFGKAQIGKEEGLKCLLRQTNATQQYKMQTWMIKEFGDAT